ncbi:hypothetical protein Hdeb2414_s0020g00553161 [Helianthus debilis subsp. tardiflorus]
MMLVLPPYLPYVESGDMGMPIGNNNRENDEYGIQPDTPDAGGHHNETSPNNMLPCVVSGEMITSADNEENIEDRITRPDALHGNE